MRIFRNQGLRACSFQRRAICNVAENWMAWVTLRCESIMGDRENGNFQPGDERLLDLPRRGLEPPRDGGEKHPPRENTFISPRPEIAPRRNGFLRENAQRGILIQKIVGFPDVRPGHQNQRQSELRATASAMLHGEGDLASGLNYGRLSRELATRASKPREINQWCCSVAMRSETSR